MLPLVSSLFGPYPMMDLVFQFAVLALIWLTLFFVLVFCVIAMFMLPHQFQKEENSHDGH